MSWSDAAEIQSRLDGALNAYQWSAAAAVGDALIRRLYEERDPYPEAAARQALASLRRKRQFPLAARVAEAFVRTGQVAPRVRRQYAQALIDQGILLGAETVLQGLLMEPLGAGGEAAEAHGLLGRIYKQLYVNAAKPENPSVRGFFERALSEYLQIYRRDPNQFTWHGVNAVALLRRAEADGIDLTHNPPADSLARAILASLPDRSGGADPFQLATRAEALIALGRIPEATAVAIDYISHPDADAFELASTLRQMEEVWRLRADSPPGSTIVTLLRAALLRRDGSLEQTFTGGIDHNIALVEQAKRDTEAVQANPDVQLEKIFGDTAAVSLEWLQRGLECGKSIARIERLSGDGHGTGWLVRSHDFFPKERFPDGRMLLLTNAHVVNQNGTGGALAPDDARANFQALGHKCHFAPEVIWSSAPDHLDATFLDFRDPPPVSPPLSLLERRVKLTVPDAPRLYIIGHPGGGDLKFSIQNNRLLGCNDRLLHYKTPTEGGSSGSPVFEAEAWRVVGLHHAGGRFQRLDGKQPPYDANEGIAILAIKSEIAANPASV